MLNSSLSWMCPPPILVTHCGQLQYFALITARKYDFIVRHEPRNQQRKRGNITFNSQIMAVNMRKAILCLFVLQINENI